MRLLPRPSHFVMLGIGALAYPVGQIAGKVIAGKSVMYPEAEDSRPNRHVGRIAA